MANAYTQLADVMVPSLFAAHVAEASVVQNKLISAGFVTVNPALSAFLAGPGFVQPFPSFLHTDVSDTAALVPSDDASVTAEAEKITSHSQVAIKLMRNKVWQAASIVGQMIGADPLKAAAGMAATAMNKVRQTSLIKVLQGTLNETVSAALVNTIGVEIAGNVSAATSLTASTIIDTLGAWGDNASTDGVALVIHSDQYRVLQKANLISFVPTSAQDIGFGTYLGMTLVVDDTCPKRAGQTSGNVYTSYLIRTGGVNFGMATTPDAVELYRAPLAGNSGGVDSLIVRDTFTFHVNGYAWTGATDAIPTDSALATAGNWTKKFSTKQIGALAIVSN